MTNSMNTTLYVGVTTNIYTRIWEHRTSQYPTSFTARYKLFKLVYYEGFYLVTDAIIREKFIKGKSRGYKIELINVFNPSWNDLQDKTADL
jgi:putative endonuclease